MVDTRPQLADTAMEEFLARKYPVNRRKSLTVFYRFSKQCWRFCQNGTECNDKNYSKKLPYYGRTTQNIILSPRFPPPPPTHNFRKLMKYNR